MFHVLVPFLGFLGFFFRCRFWSRGPDFDESFVCLAQCDLRRQIASGFRDPLALCGVGRGPEVDECFACWGLLDFKRQTVSRILGSGSGLR